MIFWFNCKNNFGNYIDQSVDSTGFQIVCQDQCSEQLFSICITATRLWLLRSSVVILYLRGKIALVIIILSGL